MSDSLRPHGLQHTRLPCPSPTLELTQTHVQRVGDAIQPSHPLSCPSPPAFTFSPSESFPGSHCFVSGGQSIGVLASTSVFPVNIRDWFPLVCTGWISLQSKGLSGVFSNTTVQKHRFLVLSFLHSPTLTSIHDYWKNHSFDYTDLCQQSDVYAFLICHLKLPRWH